MGPRCQGYLLFFLHDLVISQGLGTLHSPDINNCRWRAAEPHVVRGISGGREAHDPSVFDEAPGSQVLVVESVEGDVVLCDLKYVLHDPSLSSCSGTLHSLWVPAAPDVT